MDVFFSMAGRWRKETLCYSEEKSDLKTPSQGFVDEDYLLFMSLRSQQQWTQSPDVPRMSYVLPVGDGR